jgi:hypothetical protein
LITENGKNFADEKNLFSNKNLLPEASMKDVQATGEAFSLQKRTSSTFFKTRSGSAFPMRYWILQTKIN